MGRLYLSIAFALVGSSVIAARFVSTYIPPFSTTFFSLVFASLTAILFCGNKMYHTAKSISVKTWTVIILQAVFGCFLFRVFLTLGLQHIGAIEAGIIIGATPAITALFARIILREHLSLRIAAGILITFAGILLVQGFPFETSLEKLLSLGAILVLCAAACESLFTILSRKIHVNPQQETLNPLVHAGFISICAMVLCFIPTLIERPWEATKKLPHSGWIALIWYGSIVTIVAFAFMFAGAKRCSGYTIAAFAGLIPITSAVLSTIVLKEPINIYQIIGCGLIVISIIIMSRKKHEISL